MDIKVHDKYIPSYFRALIEHMRSLKGDQRAAQGQSESELKALQEQLDIINGLPDADLESAALPLVGKAGGNAVDAHASAEHVQEMHGDHEDDVQEDPLDAKITQPIIGQSQITVNLQVRAKEEARVMQTSVLPQTDMFFAHISKRDSERQIHFFTLMNVFSVRVTVVNDAALANVKTQEQLDNLSGWQLFSANVMHVNDVYPTMCRMLAVDQQKFYFGTKSSTFGKFS